MVLRYLLYPVILIAFCGNFIAPPEEGCEYISIKDPLYIASVNEDIIIPLFAAILGYTVLYTHCGGTGRMFL